MRAGIRSRPWAGIDVGSFSVKLLLAHGGGRFGLVEQPLPAPSPDGSQSPELVARTIAEALSRLEATPRGLRGVTLGISGADVIVKQISLPMLDDAEVGPALRFEARKHLPFDPQTMIIDFQIISRSPTQKRLDVLLAAVSREHAERHCAPLKLLGIDVDILDATPLALTNALANGADVQREGFLLLDIGHAASHLTLYQRGEPYFTRRLEFGGRTLTQAISQGTRVPLEEAEEWKLAAGSDEPGLRVDWNSGEMQAVHECLRRDLAEELRRSFAFYRTLGQLPDPLKLWISGGSARLPGLADQLGELLGTPAELFDPLKRMPAMPNSGAPAPQFAQAYGLALRTA
jgi:type IV pilus assembly protein PilM